MAFLLLIPPDPVMKTKLLLAALTLSPWLAASLPAQAPTAPKTDKEKLSYAMGMDVGTALKKQSIEVDPQFFAAAIRDTLTGAPTQLTNEQMVEVLTVFSKEIQAKRAAQMAQAKDSGKAEGEKFLAANKTKPGVKTLPSGLQYKVIQEGSGPSPKATDTVSVNYRGTLINGTEFDSNAKSGKPITFPVNGVIPGWTEALQLMKTGSKWQLFIPSNLAYGERGAGADIGPNSTLIFDVELLGIEKK
jgi:FKBP-type peptidyl-prolyl cis-trans isomerase FklB